MMKYYSKRFISVLLMVCMLLAGFPTQAFAIESANYTLNYTANGDSTVTITGISVAEGFEEADLAVEIPETIDGMTVTKIEGTRWSTFAGYHVTSVSIPASVTEIGAGAFMNCQYLFENVCNFCITVPIGTGLGKSDLDIMVAVFIHLHG